MNEDATTYRAFISYSHTDKASATWLHRALEGYRIPSKLVGHVTDEGEVPARLTPIFRDRDELPAAGDLSDELRKALGHSRFLIVIASPAAAKSRWVDEEVRQFKRLHGEGRVLALIASGRPGSGDAEECFPPSMRFKLDGHGHATDVPAEPIAADLREGGDGKRLAKLKLVAGLTGLPLDALVRREAVRRQRRLIIVAALAIVLAIAMSVLALLALRGQAEAQRQRAEADGLVEYMLTDLRDKLEPVGRLEIFDSVGQRALTYYAKQDINALDADALGRRARALHLVGEVRELRGNTEDALEAFKQAERTTAELLARNPDDTQQIFDHAQSVYWVGYIDWQRKQLDEAERRFREYDRLAGRLVALEPGKQEWQIEKSNALTNLGVLFQERQRYGEAATNFRLALAASETLAKADPANRDLQYSLAQAHAWLADALRSSWDFTAATRERENELAVYQAMLAVDSRDAKAREGKSVALSLIAQLQLLAGDHESARSSAHTAHDTITALAAEDPDNKLWQELVVSISNQLTEALLLSGQWEEADRMNRQAVQRAAALVASDPTVKSWRTGPLMTARWMQIALRFALDERAAARSQIQRFNSDFSADRDVEKGGPRTPWIMVLAMEALDRKAAGDSRSAEAQVAAVRALMPDPPQPREQAVLRYLETELGLNPIDSHLPPDDAPAPAQGSGYTPGVFLHPAKGS